MDGMRTTAVQVSTVWFTIHTAKARAIAWQPGDKGLECGLVAVHFCRSDKHHFRNLIRLTSNVTLVTIDPITSDTTAWAHIKMNRSIDCHC